MYKYEVRVPCVKFEDPLDWTCVRERAGILFHLCAGVVRAQTEGEAVSTSSLTRLTRAPIELPGTLAHWQIPSCTFLARVAWITDCGCV